MRSWVHYTPSVAVQDKKEVMEQLREFVKGLNDIGHEAQRTNQTELAVERVTRLERKIQKYLAENVAKAESGRFYEKINHPGAWVVYRDPIVDLYKNHLEPASSFTIALIEALENNDIN